MECLKRSPAFDNACVRVCEGMCHLSSSKIPGSVSSCQPIEGVWCVPGARRPAWNTNTHTHGGNAQEPWNRPVWNKKHNESGVSGDQWDEDNLPPPKRRGYKVCTNEEAALAAAEPQP